MQAQFKDSYVPLYKVEGLTLSVMSAEDVVQQSVIGIEEDGTYKENGDPITRGINDGLMGTMDKDRLCKTCMGSQVDCPGHFGHIALAKPVYHGSMLDYTRKVLRCVCYSCSNLLCDYGERDPAQGVEDRMEKEMKAAFEIKNAKSRFNYVYKIASNLKQCKKCEFINHKYKKGPLKIHYEILDKNCTRPNNDPKQTLWPEDAYRVLSKISPQHLKLLGLSKEKANPANMIIEALAVAPPPVRPSVAMTNTMRSEDDLTIAYRQIIKQNNEIRRAIDAGNNEASIRELRQVLQFYTAALMDNDIQGAATLQHKTGKPIKAIRARLKGKEGRLRGNLMGKRVDFSARSVITPDPNLHLDQLGVPRQIAINLTVPEVVTKHNQNYLRQLVEKGANTWPGAKYIKRLDGKYIDLSMLNNRTDQHLEIGYTVERHLQDDDYVIFNRQPSLHKMSMMGHRVRVLEYQTFRLNLSVTTPYNADFDGDEMNMHVPQSLETKAEIKEIMAVPRQIVAPQSNKPCMGIVQDSLLGINRMTTKETFISKEFVMDLLMWVNYDLEKGLPTPAIIKPKPMWTGKQILSLVIPETINLEKISSDAKLDSHKDQNIIIQQGELLSGVMNKNTVGSAPGGLIHITWKDLGPQACSDLLSNIQLLVNNWLVATSFTIGVQDIIALPEIMSQVQSTIITYKRKVAKIIQIANNGQLKSQPGKSMIESFEAQVNKQLNDARNKAGKIALQALAADNRLKNMVNAGSKGSDLNISQIMACVGQQNVEGKRIPFGFSKRALPHFTKDNFGPESKGFVENSYLTGLTPQEFYFHAMGGREGLIDTAVKTADTGYISRRLMKALEDVMVKYDGTVRTSREVLVQFLYGEDGMAGEHFERISLDLPKLNNEQLNQKCNFLHSLQKGDLDFRQKLAEVVGEERAGEIIVDREIQKKFQEQFDQIRNDRELLRSDVMKLKVQTDFPMPVNIDRIVESVKRLNRIKPNSKSDLDPKYYFDQIKKLEDGLCVIPPARNGVEPQSVIAEAHKNSTILFKMFLRRMLCAKKIFFEDRLDTLSFDQLVNSISEIFRSAIVNPGEMVGSVGAQSMGEPATQMTLNTFHNAGISSKNVTLGVPRLKEVINVAKTIKTPSLKIFIDPERQQDQREARKIGDAIEYTNLANLVSEWGIYYDPNPEKTIIQADVDLVENYFAVEQLHNQDTNREISRWVLRFEIDSDPIKAFFDENFEFRRDVGARIENALNIPNEEPGVEIIYSEDFMDNKVIRIRPYDVDDDDDNTVAMTLRQIAEYILNKITLRGFEEITKVFTSCSANDCTSHYYDKDTGAFKLQKGNWIIETDGVALQKVLSVEGVDPKRTSSNHVIEILQVLGIEAARNSLVIELRQILDSYGIYVNYRHLATLVDVMTQRGILTSITRHGINRVNSGPLRKCSFEETTEILLEAAFFGEHDALTGITENIIFGQLAPYGTGSFDLVVDRQQLANCLDNRMGVEFQEYLQSSEHTPIMDNPLTPTVGQTPNPYLTQGGATSVYGTPNYEGQFTPHHVQAMMSPGSPGYGIGDQSAKYSPAYGMPSVTASGQTPIYGSTPVYGYSNTPAYGSGYADSAGAYVPTAGGGASQHSSYSPTNLMQAYQSPSYSPTTPNYGAHGMTPIQHSTPTYQYGGPTPSGPTYQLPNLASPSQNPATAVGQGSSPQLSVASGNSGHHSSQFGQSPAAGQGQYGMGVQSAYNPISPSYSSSITPGRVPNYGEQNNQGSSAAYNPETAGKASDSSDSDNN